MITFVLRVAAGRDGLRGIATHVATGEARAFAGQADLWAFLEEWAAVDGIGSASAAWIADPDEPRTPPGTRASGEHPPTEYKTGR
jgi:hypothetical protein